jgi:hypothetical protein
VVTGSLVIIIKLSSNDIANESGKDVEDDAMKADVDEDSGIFVSVSNWEEESKEEISWESILIDIEKEKLLWLIYIYTKLMAVSNNVKSDYNDSFASFSISDDGSFVSYFICEKLFQLLLFYRCYGSYF